MSRTQGQLDPAHSNTSDESDRPRPGAHTLGPSHTLANSPSQIISLTNSLFAAFKARGKLLRPGAQAQDVN